jgi:hypothetical protein
MQTLSKEKVLDILSTSDECLFCDSNVSDSFDDSRKAHTAAEMCDVHTRRKGEWPTVQHETLLGSILFKSF